MVDEGVKATDEGLGDLETKIRRAYKVQKRELADKTKKFLADYEEQNKAKQALLSAGKITQKEYDDWLKSKVFQGDWLKNMSKQMADDLTLVDKKAMSMTNGFLPEAYAINRNFGLKSIADDSPVKVSFTMYDAHTVERLIRDQPELLPKAKLSIPKDQRWNQQKIMLQVRNGIMQGESMNKIAKRLQGVADMDSRAAIRNARTAVTGAQNAGRMESYHEAQRKGIIVKKRWLATSDERTRDSHAELDGVEVEVDEPFVNSDGEIMYPGDPSADPANIYNCRCTLVSVVEGFDFDSVEDMDQAAAQEQEAEALDPDFVSQIHAIQQRVADEGLSEDLVMEAGGIMQKEASGMYAEGAKKVEDAQQAKDAAMIARDKALDEKYAAQRVIRSDEFTNADPETAGQMLARLRQAEREAERTQEEYSKSLNELIEAKRKMGGDATSEMLRDKLSEVRPMGSEGLPVKAHLSGSRSPMRKNVEQAYDYYPTSWVQQSIDGGTLTVGKVDRGYYSHYQQHIAISGRGGAESTTTSVHELGHRFERVVPGIRDMEEKFYERRTAGEELKWLGSGYAKSEVTRKDDFLSPYMGKDYGGSAYELVSMGFQYAYRDPLRLAKDPDMQKWILGLLATVP